MALLAIYKGDAKEPCLLGVHDAEAKHQGLGVYTLNPKLGH